MSTMEFNYKLLDIRNNMEGMAYSLTLNKEDADDLFQETYLKALKNKDKFNPHTNIKAWTYTIMKNTFINNYRKAKRANTFFDSTDEQFHLNNAKEDKYVSSESKLFCQEIKGAIASLDDEHRIPFEMHFEGYKYKEIAENLDLSIGTVKSRIFFSRKKLMSKLPDYA